MIAISRGPGGPPASGQQAPMPRAGVASGPLSADIRPTILAQVAAENIAARLTAAQLVSSDGGEVNRQVRPGAEFNREV